MEIPREELIEQLNQAVQRNGNITVLLTNAIAQKIGLSATEFECADVLQECGPVSAGELAKRCGLSTGGVTYVVDRLVKAGLAKRTPDPKDRRKVIIEAVMPEAMRQKIIRLYEPMSQGFVELMQQYDDAELQVILDFSRRSSDIAEKLRERLSLDS